MLDSMNGTRPPAPISLVVTEMPRRPVRGQRPIAVKVLVSVPSSNMGDSPIVRSSRLPYAPRAVGRAALMVLAHSAASKSQVGIAVERKGHPSWMSFKR